MVIDIRNLQKKIKIRKKEIKGCIEYTLRIMDEDESELSLLLVSDARMRGLNKKYRDKDSSTDVLAFPMRSRDGIAKKGPVLGDVVVSVETAKREAVKRKVPVHKEICLYVVHGILHLLGYDDHAPDDRKKMKAKEEALLKKQGLLGINPPAAD